MSDERQWELPEAVQAVLPHLNELRRRLMVAVIAWLSARRWPSWRRPKSSSS
jgi:hypothetical protein